MSNENKKNDALSFEDLKKQLDMAGSKVEKKAEITETKTEKVVDTVEVNKANAEVSVEDKVEKPKTVTPKSKREENFVDITAQFITEDEEVEEKPEETKKKSKEKTISKKRVRTFNEIFSDFFKGFIPQKKDSVKEKFRKIVMDISLIAIITCAFAFVKYYVEYRQQLTLQEGLKSQIIDSDNMSEDQINQAWQELFAQFPNIEFPAGMKPDYAYLYATNPHLVGWLTIPNTNLDVQIVQSENNDDYLYRDFYRQESRYGTPYMDYRNNPKDLDDNTVIYGHHMTDGLMFSNLDKYKTLEGYKDSPIINFSTLYKDYQFKVFAVMITTGNTADNDGFNYMVSEFTTDEKFQTYINEVKARSLINTNVTVNSDDKLITLITCSHDFDDARLVVVGRMVREGEDATVDVSKATLNSSPKYPQAWYDKKGKENPYA